MTSRAFNRRLLFSEFRKRLYSPCGRIPVRRSSSLTIGQHSVWEDLLVDVSDVGLMSITLNRPHRKNALSSAMGNSLINLANAIGSLPPTDPIRAVLVKGKGGAFSSGRDLKDSRTMTSVEDKRRYLRCCMDSCNAVASIPVPVIAVVSGPCFGWVRMYCCMTLPSLPPPGIFLDHGVTIFTI